VGYGMYVFRRRVGNKFDVRYCWGADCRDYHLLCLLCLLHPFFQLLLVLLRRRRRLSCLLHHFGQCWGCRIWWAFRFLLEILDLFPEILVIQVRFEDLWPRAIVRLIEFFNEIWLGFVHGNLLNVCRSGISTCIHIVLLCVLVVSSKRSPGS